ncbi:RimK family alpha-L-glutamate ligase [Actinoplanes sp. NPDC049681]|uniref:RimK family alpha-L-glutamate ligase n=1 Tax=Actinoplanes sp. NPDC049681 TaxID=3363905 RepID=UPI0037AA3F0A
MRIALVTSRGFPDPLWRDTDSPLVAGELRARGATPEIVTWDGGERVEWAGYDAVVLQSPWSMWTDLSAFDQWLWARELDGTRLLNPLDAIALGSNKRYLSRLGEAGVPIVPTTLVEKPDPDTLRDLFRTVDPARPTVVAKPIASGGTLGAREFAADELPALAAYLRELGTAIVQPYVAAIDTHRELGVVTLDGAISHAVTKAAILRPGDRARAFHPDPQPYPGFTAQQERVIRQTYAELRGLLVNEPLSVRLDFIIDPASPSGLLLLEAELVAPVKFFPHFPDQCGHYAEAIIARAAA